MLNNILVVADQDIDQLAAMEKARSVALDETRITVLGFVPASAGVDDKKIALQKAVDTHFSDCASATCDVVATDDIAGYCRQYCADNPTDLVIKTGNRSESLFYTPLDWQLVRELDCPVFISTLQKWRARHTVMATIDVESKEPHQIAMNKKVILWAQAWAQKHNCALHVAYCINVQKALAELDIVTKDEVEAKKAKDVEAKLQAFLKENAIDYSSILIKAGEAPRVLPSLANKLKADLVVIGSIGRKGLKGALLGNTAEKTMHKLRTDIAVIHPD
ncbi:MAG: universal stress protein [Gammaproteobacteria bacterium]